jgi:hypothetical protein
VIAGISQQAIAGSRLVVFPNPVKEIMTVTLPEKFDAATITFLISLVKLS